MSRVQVQSRSLGARRALGLWLSGWLWLLCMCSSMAVSALDLQGALPADGMPVWNGVEVLEGEYQPATFDHALLSSTRWRSVPRAQLPVFGERRVWLRFHLANPHAEERNLLLIYPQAYVGHLRVHLLSGERLLNRFETGNDAPFHSRAVPHRFFMFPVDLAPYEEVSVYIQVQGRARHFAGNLRLADRDLNLHVLMDVNQWLDWFFLGVVTVMLIYNLVIFANVRDPAYLFFVAYLATLVGVFLANSGFGAQLLWADNPWMGMRMPVLMTALLFIAYILLADHVLKLRVRMLLVWYWLAALAVLLAALAAATVPVDFIAQEVVFAWGLSVLGACVTFTIIGVSWVRWRAGDPGAGGFLLAWTGYLGCQIGVMLFSGYEELWTPQVQRAAQLLHLLLLAFALSSRLDRLRREEEHSRASSRAKAEFLAKMSHEIRTPMNGVMGMAELLRGTPLDASQKHSVEIIHASAQNLLGIIDDILDYSKIEAGKMRLEQIAFDLQTVANESVLMCQGRAQEKDLELLLTISPALSSQYVGDPTRLRQILSNLVGNAVKFTEHGYVRLALDVDSHDRHKVRFEVSDTGIGIDQAHLQGLFESFEQAKTSTARRYGGSGLGLAICKQLVELMGGEIGVSSQQGVGSTFWFVLPLVEERAASSVAEVAAALADGLQGRRCVVAVRQRVYGEALVRQLQEWGCQAVLSQQGWAVLAEVQQAAQAGHPFDLLILEERLPDIDGAALLRILRGRPNLVLPAIVLTRGHLRLEQPIESCWLLPKPVYPRVMAPVMAEALALQGPATTPAAPSEGDVEPVFHRLRVLVAEDNLINQKVVVGMLSKMGHDALVVQDGREAYELLARGLGRGEAVPDLVLMDCEMPEMDGFAATRAIRALEASLGREPLPICALTAHAVKEVLHACLEAGMDHYLTKPVNMANLKDALEHCIQCRGKASGALLG